MSRFVRQIVSRPFDVGMRACVSPGTLARYFEFARRDAASSEEGTGMASVFAAGGTLVIRAQSQRLFHPIAARETLDIELSVPRVGTSSVHFVHIARRDGVIVARNDAIGVALGADGKPTRMPDVVRARATGEPVEAPARVPEPPATPAFACDIALRWEDLDGNRHVNHSRYVDYIDELFMNALSQRAFTVAGPSAEPWLITIEYERETRMLPERGPGRSLRAQAWQIDAGTFGCELIDPLDGLRVARAMLRAGGHEASSLASLAGRGLRL